MLAWLTFPVVLGFSFVAGVLSSPVKETRSQPFRSNNTDVSRNATFATPHWLVYSDRSTDVTGPPPVSEIKGFNVFALSFLLVKGAFDKADEWTQLSASQRATIKSQYAAAGIKLIVSLFGETDAPTSEGADPIDTANTMAAWVKQFDLDGVDVDYEDFKAINRGDGQAEAWLVSFTRQLRTHLPQGQYILTHAPVAPWFSPGRFGGGAYLTVHETVGNLIDWYNIQFYNQGDDEYTTCDGLLNQSSDVWPNSAIFQIADSGVPLNKLVVGKPALPDDATNGFMSASALANCLRTAKNSGWNAGGSVWEFPGANSTWIQAVRASSFPVRADNK